MVSTSAFAQNETSVQISRDYTYTVSQGNGDWTGSPSYQWKVFIGNDTSGAEAVANTDYRANVDGSFAHTSLQSALTNRLYWLKAGTYTIEVIATDGTTCLSDPTTITITVEQPEIQFATATESGESCSWIASGTGNTTGSWDQISFDIESTGGFTPITVTYTITATDVDGSNDVNLTGLTQPITLTAGTPYTGTMTINIDTNFITTTNSDVTYTVTLISANDTN